MIQNGYPDNWSEIAQRVKDAAGWRCEHCGHPHDPGSGYTLTVHHLDSDKTNCSDDNLVALCQRCHLHWQARYLPAQLWLPGIEPPGWMVRRHLAAALSDGGSPTRLTPPMATGRTAPIV